MTEQNWPGTVVLENASMKVSLSPSLGNNLYRILDKRMQREVLRVPPSLEAFRDTPGRYGTPVLLPPSRIRQGTFRFEGREYRFQPNLPEGHYIHGFLRERPWKVVMKDECSITSSFRTADFPELLEQYPHLLEVHMTYELSGLSLIQKVKVTNEGQDAAPFGFGLHTWFLLDHEPQKWRLQLQAEGIWEFGKDQFPTGIIRPLFPYEVITDGLGLQNADMDTVFRIGDHPRIAVLSKEGYEIQYRASGMFKHWIIYTGGPANEFICIEPCTWVTNAPNLDLDPEITGLKAIAPGETVDLEVILSISHTDVGGA